MKIEKSETEGIMHHCLRGMDNCTPPESRDTG